MKYLFQVFFVLAIEIKVAECDVGCRYIGYDGGTFIESGCQCITAFDYEYVARRKPVTLPNKTRTEPTYKPTRNSFADRLYDYNPSDIY